MLERLRCFFDVAWWRVPTLIESDRWRPFQLLLVVESWEPSFAHEHLDFMQCPSINCNALH